MILLSCGVGAASTDVEKAQSAMATKLVERILIILCICRAENVMKMTGQGSSYLIERV